MSKALAGGTVLALASLAVAPIAAQQSAVQNRVIASLDTRLVQPECKLEGGGDFRVSSGKTYLKTGIEGSGDPSNRVNALKNGVRVITEAITTAGQSKNPSAWYYLGRIYLQQGDLAGADSAFTRAEALAPGCKADIQKYRYRAWAALVNGGQSFRQNSQLDSAMIMYRAASSIYRDAPLAYVVMADIFNENKQADSALYYFGLGAATDPTDPNQKKTRDQAAYNYGVLLLQAGRGQEAVAAFHRYLSLQPDDAAGKKGLAQAFRSAGMTDSAQAVERELVSTAAATPAGGGDVSESDLMDIAVKQFNDKNYKEAAETFGRIIQANPWNRDAIFNQANAYLALQDGAKLVEASEKLLRIEPLSEYDYTLRAQGYKLAGNQDGLYKAIVAREAQPVNLEVESLKLGSDEATLAGKVTGREPRDEANKVLPPKPVNLTVEFLGADGAVVASQDLTIPALKPGESQPFSVTGKGSGIKAWRYKVK
jgi:tetratricopeptide (TPR) repeat protein